jgi:hypothetical protein
MDEERYTWIERDNHHVSEHLSEHLSDTFVPIFLNMSFSDIGSTYKSHGSNVKSTKRSSVQAQKHAGRWPAQGITELSTAATF